MPHRTISAFEPDLQDIEERPGLGSGRFGAFWKAMPAFATFALFWEVVPRIGLFDQRYLPPFSKVLVAFLGLLLDGTLFNHSAVSLQRLVLGLAFASAVALPLGFLFGTSPRLYRFVSPLVEFLRHNSELALMPVFVLLLGIGETTKIFVLFWAAVWPLLLATIAGVRDVDPLHVKDARSMNASSWQVLTKITWPSALPAVFSGLRISATYSILVLITAEMLGKSPGLGNLVAGSALKPTRMFAAIAATALFGLGVNYALLSIERRLDSWRVPPSES